MNTSSRRAKVKPPETEIIEILVPAQSLGTFRSGSLPNVAAPQPATSEPEVTKVPCYGLSFLDPIFFANPAIFVDSSGA